MLNDCRGKELAVPDRRAAPGRLPLLLLRSLPFFPGVDGSSPPIKPLMTTEDAGELPGVPIMLPKVDLSFETMLEIESRSCWFFLSVCASSILTSSSSIISLRLSHFFCISKCSLRISPLTVRRSLTPFSMIERTRSIAGP